MRSNYFLHSVDVIEFLDNISSKEIPSPSREWTHRTCLTLQTPPSQGLDQTIPDRHTVLREGFQLTLLFSWCLRSSEWWEKAQREHRSIDFLLSRKWASSQKHQWYISRHLMSRTCAGTRCKTHTLGWSIGSRGCLRSVSLASGTWA